MCPHTCVTNIPKPREPQPDVGPAAMFVGNIVQGVRIAGARGRDLGPDEERVRHCTLDQTSIDAFFRHAVSLILFDNVRNLVPNTYSLR